MMPSLKLYDYIVRDPDIAGHNALLMLGMGRGYVSFLLAAQNPRAMITGIDYSPMQVRAAEKFRLERKIVKLFLYSRQLS